MRISDWSSDVCSSDRLLIVGDGSRLTMIDYEVNQVQSWPVKNSPLGALLDPDRDLTKYAKILPTANDDVLSVEVKDPKRPERSEERRVGQECVSKCRSRRSP